MSRTARRHCRLLVVALWALLAPAALGWYAYSGARVDWTSSVGATRTRPDAWAYGLAGPAPEGVSPALALVSYVVEHRGRVPAAVVIQRGNAVLGAAPTGYRLARTIGHHRIAVLRHRGVYFVCVRVEQQVVSARGHAAPVQVGCGAIRPPLHYTAVVWTSGRTLHQATRPHVYRTAAAAQTATLDPSVATMASLALDWTTHLGHGSQGDAVALGLALGLLLAAGLAWRLAAVRRSSLRPGWAAAVVIGLVAADLAGRCLLGPGSPHARLPIPLLGFALGNGALHGHIGVWGNEGPLTAAAIGLAGLLAALTAARAGNRLMLVAAALTLLGMLTNWGEVALRGYDTDYLWFGSSVRATPFNLGDLYQFGGGLVLAWCCLRLVVGSAADRPDRGRRPAGSARQLRPRTVTRTR